MAACGFGIAGLKSAALDLGCLRFNKMNALHPLGLRAQETVMFDALVLSHRSNRGMITACQSSNIEADSTMTTNLEDDSSDMVSSNQPSTLIPNSYEMESLLTTVCDTTSVAEFQLKLGGFHLHVIRNLADQSAPPQPPLLAPVISHSVVETPDFNGSASSPSLALTKAAPSSAGVQTLLEKAADEGLAILHSPRVGYFRRSRTIKGKRAPPSCKEKDVVKEGQVLCYIEQLGGEIPVEADISGEVVKILKEDGEPVGYGDALIAVLPSFPGIMKLQ